MDIGGNMRLDGIGGIAGQPSQDNLLVRAIDNPATSNPSGMQGAIVHATLPQARERVSPGLNMVASTTAPVVPTYYHEL